MPNRNRTQAPLAPEESRRKTDRIMSWLEEKQGEDVVAIDVSGICSVADVMVVVTAQNRRHAQTLADHVLGRAGQEKYAYLGMEGYANAVWILLDLNDVLVHVFQKDERLLYDIEGLWSEGVVLTPGRAADRDKTGEKG